MAPPVPFSLGLVVRASAYTQRSARAQLDVALLAATLDFELRVYFVGDAVLQLVAGDVAAARLPAGYRAWASLPDLLEHSELQVFAEQESLDSLVNSGVQVCLPVKALSASQMRKEWGRCERLLSL